MLYAFVNDQPGLLFRGGGEEPQPEALLYVIILLVICWVTFFKKVMLTVWLLQVKYCDPLICSKTSCQSCLESTSIKDQLKIRAA